MERLREMFGSSHELVQLITQCLDYAPSARPTASETMDRLQHISSSIHDDYHTMTRLQLEKGLKIKDETIQLLLTRSRSIEVCIHVCSKTVNIAPSLIHYSLY